MKNILLILLLALSQISAFAQKVKLKGTTSITLPDSVAYQGWTENKIRQLIKESGGIVTPPIPGMDSCDRGPTISEIYAVSDTALSILYDAENVIKLGYKISHLSGSEVFSNSVNPQNNRPLLTYPKLSAGIYNLTVWGVSCISESNTKSFSIPLPPVVISPCDEGPEIKKIQSLSATSLTVLYHGKNVFELGWQIKTDRGAQIREGSLKPENNHPVLNYDKLSAGEYSLTLYGINCSTVSTPVAFTIKSDEGGGTTPPPVPVPTSTNFGTYKTKVGNKTYMYNKSPNLQLSFTEKGISDVTPGLILGTPNRLPDRDVYYMVGYHTYGNTRTDGTKIYNSLQNIEFPDGEISIRQFRMQAGLYRDIEDFRYNLNGWLTRGVNKYHGELSEIVVNVATYGAPVRSSSWLNVSRRLNFPDNGLDYQADGSFGTYMFNVGTDPKTYAKIGVSVEMTAAHAEPVQSQPYGFKVWKHYPDGASISIAELREDAQNKASAYQFGPASLIMDEYPENTQGQDGEIHQKMHNWYEVALQNIKSRYPEVKDKNQTALYGPYGGYGNFNQDLLYNFSGNGRKIFEESLTSHVHRQYDPTNANWSTDSDGYYAWGDINTNNVNINYYMYNGERQIPTELLYTNERVKIGTQTFEGKNRESKWITLTMPMVQNITRDATGQIGIEETKDGDIIPYKNGSINPFAVTPSLPDEMYPLGFYGTFLGDGIAIWGEWGAGQDTTKFNDDFNNPRIRWVNTNGISDQYRPGFDGAPLASKNGLNASLSTSAVDAAYAGWKIAKQIKPRSQIIYNASYSSDRGSFKAVPGDKGLRISGRGFINKGLFVCRDIIEQRKGTALVGEGPEGKVAVYYNGFLSQHEYEDNVIIVHDNQAVNIGRAYGRQIVIHKF